jgi:O-antigen/teichoic acid export membrane protein
MVVGVVQITALFGTLLVHRGTLPALLVMQALGFLAGSLVGQLDLKSCISEPHAKARVRAFVKWQLLSQLLNWCTNNMLMLLTASLLGVGDLAGVRAASSVGGAANLIAQSTENHLPRDLAHHVYIHGAKGLVRVSFRRAQFSLTALALSATPLILAPHLILRVLYGADFARYSWLIVTLTLVALLAFICTVLQSVIRALGKASGIFFSYAFVAVLSLTTSWPLLHFLGLKGFALGSVLLQTTLLAAYMVTLVKALRANRGPNGT